MVGSLGLFAIFLAIFLFKNPGPKLKQADVIASL
jgi:hypothetical protein